MKQKWTEKVVSGGTYSKEYEVKWVILPTLNKFQRIQSVDIYSDDSTAGLEAPLTFTQIDRRRRLVNCAMNGRTDGRSSKFSSFRAALDNFTLSTLSLGPRRANNDTRDVDTDKRASHRLTFPTEKNSTAD